MLIVDTVFLPFVGEGLAVNVTRPGPSCCREASEWWQCLIWTTNNVQAHSPAHQIMLWEVTCQFAPTKSCNLLTHLFKATFKNTPEWERAFPIALKFHFPILANATLEIYFHHIALSDFIVTGMCVDTMLPKEDQQCMSTEIFDLSLWNLISPDLPALISLWKRIWIARGLLNCICEETTGVTQSMKSTFTSLLGQEKSAREDLLLKL